MIPHMIIINYIVSSGKLQHISAFTFHKISHFLEAFRKPSVYKCGVYVLVLQCCADTASCC